MSAAALGGAVRARAAARAHAAARALRGFLAGFTGMPAARLADAGPRDAARARDPGGRGACAHRRALDAAGPRAAPASPDAARRALAERAARRPGCC